jgi:predicted nucleic acid-binding protein
MTASLLDTSALLAWYFDEPGADELETILAAEEVLLSVVSRVELHGRLREIGLPPTELGVAVEQCLALATEVVGIDDAVAVRACELRAETPSRLPLTDALIAACASLRGARLVHRDPHFEAVPGHLLEQRHLAGS